MELDTDILGPLIGARPRMDLPDDQVRAMPLILRIEKSLPPDRTDLLEAAAAAALAVCLDVRSAPGGPWHESLRAWIDWQIRKVARRARGAHWNAAHDLDGVTVTVGTAQVRALVPTLIADTPKIITRLQVGGTELAPDSPGEADPQWPLLTMNPDVTMTVGKAAAQVGHASMLLAADLVANERHAELAAWAESNFRCAVRMGDAHWAASAARAGAVVVHDAGYTEVAPNTATVLARY